MKRRRSQERWGVPITQRHCLGRGSLQRGMPILHVEQLIAGAWPPAAAAVTEEHAPAAAHRRGGGWPAHAVAADRCAS